ncbi:MBL fold metallo-hydrolase [Litoribacillus peritrichatus]|uniref:MBL fold metallo-hydrolase n=1 Tax=Litoribacillus peritrichatus TaxID=718191 RepID=A0ABP7NAB7_9GAMM
MQFASIGSGSKGNATLIKAKDTVIMIDCGFTAKEAVRRLAALELTPNDLSAILVTHEHGDHIKGVPVLARKYKIPAYMTYGTARAKSLEAHQQLQVICSHELFEVGAFKIQPVIVPHDAQEPVQFVVSHQERKLGVLTDLGSYTPYVINHYKDCDAILLECNHDLDMLRQGPYPPSLKRRVAGDYGHLNNQQAAEFVRHVDQDKLQHLVVSHVSHQNNDVQLSLDALDAVIQRERQWIRVADQDEGFGWLSIE